MKNYLCPDCNKEGISWVGRNFSAVLLPATCNYCKCKFYLKQNWAYVLLVSVIDVIAGIVVLILTIAHKTPIYFIGYVVFVIALGLLFHRNAPLVKKDT